MNTLPKILPFLAAFSASAFADNYFYLNQAGYDSDKPISIVVKSTNELEGTKWTLFYAPDDNALTGATVLEGTFGKGSNPDNWANNGKFYTININQTLPYSGQFYIANVEGSPSSSDYFIIKEKALATNTLGMVMNYFYNDRANNATIMSWDQEVSVYGSSGVTRDVRGGWYDASGDVSKYLSHLSYANYLNPQQIPLTVWSLAFAAERIPTLLAATTTKAPAAEEAAFGADFLVRMLDEQGFFYMTVFDNWGMGSRYLCAFSGSDGKKSANYQTAFREGGGMAIAGLARVSKLGVKGDFTSEQYLAAAEKGFAHLSEKQSIGGTCAYCDDNKENIIDDYTALLAATELYAATETVTYLMEARKRAEHLISRLSEKGYFWSDNASTRPFWHASDAGLPLIALIRYAEIESAINTKSSGSLIDWSCPASLNSICNNPHLEQAVAAIQQHYSWLINVTNNVDNPFGYARQTYKTNGEIKDGFFIPHDNESNYWWQGEDARLASLSAAISLTGNSLGVKDSILDKYATDQLDWILGKNPYSTCMMYGIGKKNPNKYNGQSEYDATLEGGIANGITGKNNDGSGIAWDDDGVSAVGFDPLQEAWNNWRWIEQWLPHSTWYLMALATRYDEKSVAIYKALDTSNNPLQPPISIQKPQIAKNFNVHLQGKVLLIHAENLKKNTSVNVIDINGKNVATATLSEGNTTINLANLQSGIYIVKVNGFGTQKIALK